MVYDVIIAIRNLPQNIRGTDDLFGVPKTLGLMAGRSTYIIDQQGIIRHVIHSSFRAHKHVDEALRIVQTLTNT